MTLVTVYEGVLRKEIVDNDDNISCINFSLRFQGRSRLSGYRHQSRHD